MPKDSKKVKVTVTFSKKDAKEIIRISEKLGITVGDFLESALQEECDILKKLENKNLTV